MSSTLRWSAHAVIVLGLVAGCAPGRAMKAEPMAGLKPAEPQPAAEQLAPGLAVQYTYAIMNQLLEMNGRRFEAGPPILHLDWRMGEGIVLTSRDREGVGAILRGFLRFERPGTYGFEVTSNDGVRLEIGGVVIHESPGVHPDSTSDVVDVRIDQPGWYPIAISYFQKRGSATLIVKRATPEAGGTLTALRGSELAHRK
jgi:hypothetical protein